MNELKILHSKIIKNINHYRKFYGDILFLMINLSFKLNIAFGKKLEICYKISFEHEPFEIIAEYTCDQKEDTYTANILKSYGPGLLPPFEQDISRNVANHILCDLIFEKHFIYYEETPYKNVEEFIEAIGGIDLLYCNMSCLNSINNYIKINIL